MTRLIDADKLPYVGDETYLHEFDYCYRYAIDAEPTVDAVPVIRCKDCKYSTFVDWGMNDCTHPQGLKGIAYSNSYCDRAEREEE